jgi:hypothetical protein
MTIANNPPTGSPILGVVHESSSRNWPDPTPQMLESPSFQAVWQLIRRWDIAVPDVYEGYCGATGNHVRAILDALAETGRRS